MVPEAGDVARHGGDAAYEALGGSVPPGLVAAGKDAEVHAPDELVVVDGEDGARGAEELRVEDDLYLFLLAVLEPRALEVVYDGVVAPVGDVVRCEWRCVVRLDSVEAASEERVVHVRNELRFGGQLVASLPHQRPVEQPLPGHSLDGAHRVL